MSGRGRLALTAVLATLALVIVGVVVWELALRDRATPASIDDALARYRATAAEAGTPIPPGVYVYATSGEESISALGGTTHAYPDRSTITVTPHSCGMTLRWDVLETRVTTSEICAESGGPVVQRVQRWTEEHEFFGQEDTTVWMCQESPWLVEPDATRLLPHRCDGGDTAQEGSVSLLGAEVVDVAGAAVETLHLRLEAEESGAARGRLVEERWVERETGLPVRIVYSVETENDSLIGDVTFEERYELNLTSLEPRT